MQNKMRSKAAVGARKALKDLRRQLIIMAMEERLRLLRGCL